MKVLAHGEMTFDFEKVPKLPVLKNVCGFETGLFNTDKKVYEMEYDKYYKNDVEDFVEIVSHLGAKGQIIMTWDDEVVEFQLDGKRNIRRLSGEKYYIAHAETDLLADELKERKYVVMTASNLYDLKTLLQEVSYSYEKDAYEGTDVNFWPAWSALHKALDNIGKEAGDGKV